MAYKITFVATIDGKERRRIDFLETKSDVKNLAKRFIKRYNLSEHNSYYFIEETKNQNGSIMKNQYLDDTEQAQRASKQYLNFILSNKSALLKIRNGLKLYKIAEDMNSIQLELLTGKQMSYIDAIYEKTMKGLGYPSYTPQKSKYGVNLKWI